MARNSGAMAIITTKSGGKQFHGMATEIFRNRVLNAGTFLQEVCSGWNRRDLSERAATQARLPLGDARREILGTAETSS